jgi:hypothetical protein
VKQSIQWGHHSRGIEIVTRPEDAMYPFLIEMPATGTRPSARPSFAFVREEIEELRDALTEALNFDPTPYVQVRFGVDGGFGKTYTYSDPFGDLVEGDLVDVPTAHGEHNLAIVVGFGKETAHPAYPIRPVTARYSREVAA